MSSISTLNDVATVVDCEHKTAPEDVTGQEYGFSIGTACLRGQGIDFSQAKPVSRETYFSWSRRTEIKAGDIILAREAPVGGLGFVDGSKRVCLGQRTVLIRTKADKADPRFLYYLLQSQGPQRWMEMHSEGSTVVHLNVADIRRITLGVLPDLEEQKRIAGLLGALDDLIEVNTQLMGKTLELSRALLSKFLARGFTQTKLSTISSVNPERVTRAGSEMVSYLAISDVNDGDISWPEEVWWPDAPVAARLIAEPGDIVWSRVRPNRRSHAMIPIREQRTVISTGMVILHPRGVSSAYLMAVVDAESFSTQLASLADGTAYPTVSPEVFEEVRVPLLEKEQMDQFNSVMEPLWEAFHELKRELTELTSARSNLLPPLISGRIKV